MPAGVAPPPRPEQPRQAPATVRPEHTAEPDASDALEAPRRSGLSWRHVLIGAVLGAIVGAAIPGGIQLAERAAAGADSDSLRVVATDYLTAIAEGRASDATEMVPLPRSAGEVPDAVLRSAERITEAGVRTLTIDGDIATVSIGYEVGTREVTRTLNAERMDGEWHLTDSLAEGVTVQVYSATSMAQIAGFPMPFSAPTYLYPGRYSFDEAPSPILLSVAEPFTVDGDPGAATETYFDVRLASEVEAHAGDIGVAVAQQCQAEPECSLPPDIELEHAGGAWVRGASDDGLDVSVQLMDDAGLSQQWFEARMRIVLDGAGEPTEWLCAPFDDFGTPTEPCPEVE